MNLIKYIIAKLRLSIATANAQASKNSMNKVIKSSKAAKEEIDDSYDNFLKQCKKQEKARIGLKRIQRESGNRPILNADLGTVHYVVSPEIADKLTRFDIEMAVTRHRYCDWGKVNLATWKSNNDAVIGHKGVICSKHSLYGNGFFIIEGNVNSNTVNVRGCAAA